VLVPELFVTVNVTVYFPGIKYVVDGFFKVDVAPFPKFQNQAVGFPVETSVKLTTRGEQPEAGAAVKIADGACA